MSKVRAKSHERGFWANVVRHRGLFLMTLPVILYFLLFHYVPMLGLMISFKEFRLSEGVFGSDWNGLDNFVRLFSSDDFPNALRNTIIISTLRLVFSFFAPVILALLLNEVRIAFYKRSIQTLTYLPHFLSWVILGGVFLMLFSVDGPVNFFIKILGLDPIQFLTNDFWFIVILIGTGIWQAAGYGAVIYLAALSGIDPTLYEAAVVDGAGRWKQILHISLPGITPTIITLFILTLGRVLNAGFDQVYNMYNPLVYDSADILGTYILRRLQTMDFGLATAAGMFKGIIGLMLVASANTLARKLSGGEQGVW